MIHRTYNNWLISFQHKGNVRNKLVNFNYTIGPYVYKGSVGTNSITWNKSGVYGASIHEGLLAYHISITTFDGKLYAGRSCNRCPRRI